jgi:hypothetical protein
MRQANTSKNLFASFLLSGISLLVLASCLDVTATSLGINPGRVYVDYEPGITKNISFSIINSENVKKDVSLSPMGELQNQVKIRESALVLNENETRVVEFGFEIPQELEPGLHNAEILVRLVPPKSTAGGSTVGATVGIIFQVVILKPYPKDYGRVTDVVAPDVKLGETVIFEIPFENLGNSSLKVKGFVEIYSPENKKLADLVTDEQEVLSTDSVKLRASWDTSNVTKGVYRAVIHVEYSGKSTDPVETEFRVGELVMEIVGMPSVSVKQGEVGKIILSVKNYWNEKVPNVYALINIVDSSGKVVGNAKSESFTVERWSEKEVTVYWDTSGVGLGTYGSNAVLYYANKTAERKSEIKVVTKTASVTQENSTAAPVFPWGVELFALVLFTVCILSLVKISKRRRAANKVSALLEGIDGKLDVLTAELSGNSSQNGK